MISCYVPIHFASYSFPNFFVFVQFFFIYLFFFCYKIFRLSRNFLYIEHYRRILSEILALSWDVSKAFTVFISRLL